MHSSLDTSHYSSNNCGGCERSVHRYQETSHSTSSNFRSSGFRSIITSHSASSNHILYVDRDGSRSQDTSHSSYHNQTTIVGVKWRGGYRSPTIQ